MVIALSCVVCNAEVELTACTDCYGEGVVMGEECCECCGSGAVDDGEPVNALDVTCDRCDRAEQSAITSAWVE